MKYVWLYDATRCYGCYKEISVPDGHSHSLSLLQIFVLCFEEDLLHWNTYYKYFVWTQHEYWRAPE